jgi:hypothetical protein
MDFQSGMILPTGIFETFKRPLISPITGFFVSFPAVFLCGFPPDLTTGKPCVHHDALEFPDRETVLLTRMCEGQHATVLQLPASGAL